MTVRRLVSSHASALVAITALGLACAMVVSDSGPNQAAHFALVRSLAAGTPEIDPRETIDSAYVDGRFYAAKAPGLAMFTLPWYGALRAAGLQRQSLASDAGYRHRLWELGLFGTVLPLVALLVLMTLAAERVGPGYGAASAVLVGAGTLLLPFGTLFFDHALSAALGFAAFVVLLRARESARGMLPLAAAGLLAGLAVVVEFPLAIVAGVLAAYAAAGDRRLLRLLAFGGGVVAGAFPLLAFNTWAFGSPFTLSYTHALKAPVGEGAVVVGANAEGFFGVGWPDPRAALSLLVSEKGLLVVTPLAVVALVGLPLLWRLGRRAESLVCGAVPLLFLTYNAAYYLPFGGQSPGPRFLVAALPFLVMPLAAVLRARPLVVAGIGLVSVGVMALATITGPLTGVEYSIGTWLGRLGRGETVETLAGWVGVQPGWVAAVPFVLLLAVACLAALWDVPLTADWRRDLPLLAGALGAWLLVVLVAPGLHPADEAHQTGAGTLAVLCLLAVVATALSLSVRSRLALLVLVPAFVLLLPELDARPRVSLLVTAGALGIAVLAWRRLARGGIPVLPQPEVAPEAEAIVPP
ncbi:MAG TPA: hypothetical protein VH305_03445 [Gaiella sp.]|jgi:hypothetical protein